MKTRIRVYFTLIVLLYTAYGYAQLKNAKTISFTIDVNCNECHKLIESTGTIKRISVAKWDPGTKLVTITYNAQKTNLSAIRKRMALAGFDNNEYLAPDDMYSKLPLCCQYNRINKRKPIEPTSTEIPVTEVSNDAEPDSVIHTSIDSTSIAKIESISKDSFIVTGKEKTSDKKIDKPTPSSKPSTKPASPPVTKPPVKINPLKPVYDQYFKLKDLLVRSDAGNASKEAAVLLQTITSVKMQSLDHETHLVWMKVLKELQSTSEQISKTQDIIVQRKEFMMLSNNIYALLKVSKLEIPVYYQFCPMANDRKGAYWLSKEFTIKNPYFGSQMLTCGNTRETIK